MAKLNICANIVTMFLDLFKPNTKVAKCGALGCHRIFEVVASKGTPALYICPQCEAKINYGIQVTLHTNLGIVRGNFNSVDALSKH